MSLGRTIFGWWHRTTSRRRTSAKPGTILLRTLDGKRNLLRLEYREQQKGFEWYAAVWAGVTEAEWFDALEADPRDVPWEFARLADGEVFPFHAWRLKWDGERRQLGFRGVYVDEPVDEPPSQFDVLLRRLLGLPRPRSFAENKMQEGMAHFASDNPIDVPYGLVMLATYASGADVARAADILCARVSDSDPAVRQSAVMGIGELARQHRRARPVPLDRARAEAALRPALDDPVPGVRSAAVRSLDVVRRFGRGPGLGVRAGPPA